MVESTENRYLPFNLTDEVLEQYPVIRIVEKNGKDYEVRQIIHKTISSGMKYYGIMELNTMCKTIPGCIHIFSGKIPSIVTDNGEYHVSQWTIHRLVE